MFLENPSPTAQVSISYSVKVILTTPGVKSWPDCFKYPVYTVASSSKYTWFHTKRIAAL